MNIRLNQRILSVMVTWVLLFTLLPWNVIAEDGHGHVIDLSVRATASASHVYVGEHTVVITAEINGGAAPYAVTIQAVQGGAVMFSECVHTSETTVSANFMPESYGDYELIAVVCDGRNVRVLDSSSLTVAEHETETEADWAASVAGASVSGDWASSLVSVARTQLGYRESERDFIIKSGRKQGYSRYGDWFGMPYGDWNNAFLAFVAEYAGIPGDALLSGASCSRWVNGIRAKGAYMAPGSYTPQTGDVAFLSGSRAAIVERVSGDVVQVIEGDVAGEVTRKTYAVSKLAGIGNTRLLMGLYKGTATMVPEEPAQTPAEDKPTRTAAPGVKPTATPEPAEEEELTFSATPTPRPGMTAAPRDNAHPLDNLVSAVGDTVNQLQAAATSVPAEFSGTFYLMQAEVRRVTERYLGPGEKTAAEIKAFADKLTLQEAYYLRVEMDALETYAGSIGLTAWEGSALWEREETFRNLNEAIEDRWLSLVQPRGTQALLSGNAALTYGVGEITVNGENSLTWTTVLKGNIFSSKSKDYTLTITNQYDCNAVLSFDWAVEGFSRIFGEKVSTIGSSGSKQVPMTAGGEYELTLYAVAQANDEITNILTLTNITLTPEVQNGRCILQFDTEKGGVTADGAAAAHGSSWEVDASAGITLAAEAKEGYAFLGWVNAANGAVLSSEAAFGLRTGEEIAVTAVFAREGEEAWFGVSSRGTSGSMATGYTSHVNAPVYLFDDLAKAAECAANSENSYIVLQNGGTLPAGRYTIPAGVTLLVPFDDERTLYLDTPATTGAQTAPHAYRTLTLAADAKLTINGTLSLSAKHQYASTDGCSARPIGGYGHIAMAGGSSITVGSSGKLYAWGYITGSGQVIAESGAQVYEIFQIMDFRGAVGQSMKNGVFPFSQYYVQNIEVPLTMHAGATEYVLTSAGVSGTASSALFPFIGGSGAMFNQTSGYLVKDYRESSDRLSLDAHGNLTLAGLRMELGGVDIDAADFVLPLNSNVTIAAHSGTLTINQDLALLPGAEMVIGNGAEAAIAAGVSVYAYDADEWDAYAWAGGNDAKLWPALYAPGRTGIRTAASLVDAKIHVKGELTAMGGLYSTKGGANIMGEAGAMVTFTPGSETQTYQLRQSEGNNAYKSIEIVSARLKNADGTYALTEKASGKATCTNVDGCWLCGTWTLTDGVWSCAEASRHAALVTQAEVPPSCEKDGKTAGTYCEVCGYSGQEQTAIPMTGHSLPEDWTITPATCTEDGIKVRQCQNAGCTYEETEIIEAGGHTWSDWTESKAASCTEVGEKTRSCTCGETETQDIPALDHDWAEATCTFPKACRRTGCGVTEGAALGHTYRDAQGGLIASEGAYSQYQCEKEIIITYTCTRCVSDDEGHIYEHRTGELLAHDMAYENEIPATCEDDGSAGYSWCRRDCGYTTGGTVIPARGHDWSPATCSTPKTCKREGCGATEGTALGHSWQEATCDAPKQCKNCKTVEGEALGHDWVAATCTTKKTCRRCSTTQGFELGHITVMDAGKAATCTEPGLTEGSHCGRCGETLVMQNVVPARNHDWSAATCSTPKTCKREGCGATEGTALGHSWQEATCDAPKQCKNCKTVEGEALGHDWVAATCTTKKTCRRCSTTQGFELGHITVIDAGKAATCTEPGLTEGSHCGRCGETLVAQTVIEAINHANKYAGYGYDADCSRPGLTAGLYCPDCEVWLEEQIEIPPQGHDLDEGVEAIPPTCTEAGVMAFPCRRCSYVASEDIPPRHTPVVIEAVEPTADETGSTEGSKCAACGKVLVSPEVIPALGRPTPNGWVSENGGYRYYADGAYLTGISLVDGLYYDFGENGVNPDKTPYTGLLAVDGENYYIRKGKPDTGWQQIDGSWYYFDTTTGAGLNGEQGVNGRVYPFEKGRLLRGTWVQDDVGLMYFYGPGNYDKGWQVIEGEEYFFQRGYVTTGLAPVQEAQDKPVYWYEFTDAGVKLGYVEDGLHWYGGELYYIVDGLPDRFGMHCINGDYYYFTYDDYAVRGQTFEVVQTNGLQVGKGQYRFDEDGRAIMTTEIVPENGKLVYYRAGVLTRNAGLVQLDSAYYYIDGEGVAVTNKTLLVKKTNGLVSVGSYTFGADGRMQLRLPGDANRDDAVGADDAALVFAYVAGKTVDIDLASADVNADGKTNEADGLLIMQFAAGWDVLLQ